MKHTNRTRQAEPEKDMDEVVLDSAEQIATPAFVATISICIVFTPMFLLSGVAKFLFVPLGEAVIFAMLASYLLSRTVVPMIAKYLFPHDTPNTAESRNPFVRMQGSLEVAIERLRE